MSRKSCQTFECQECETEYDVPTTFVQGEYEEDDYTDLDEDPVCPKCGSEYEFRGHDRDDREDFHADGF